MEAKDFTALKPQFDQAGVALLGVSKDSPKQHLNFIAKHGLKVDLATELQILAFHEQRKHVRPEVRA